jgi:hypothetical protein
VEVEVMQEVAHMLREMGLEILSWDLIQGEFRVRVPRL